MLCLFVSRPPTDGPETMWIPAKKSTKIHNLLITELNPKVALPKPKNIARLSRVVTCGQWDDGTYIIVVTCDENVN